MKVSGLQFSPAFHDTEQNLDKVERMLQGHESDLIILPELFNTGYMFEDRNQLASLSEDFNHSKTIDRLIMIAGKKDCAIVAGIAEKEGDKLYNSSAIVDGNGIITTYRKLHLFWDEKDLFDRAENPLPVVEYKGAMLGLMVCFDWAFPEVVRTLAMKGAEVICHPADLVLTYCQKVMVARSIENKVFTITVNRVGKEHIGDKELEFTGHSQITGIKGEYLAQTELEETIISAEIEPKDAHDKTLTPKNHVFNDRREEYYFK